MTQAAHPPVRLISPSTPSCMIDITQHALKGQKLCKLSGFLKLLPLQGALFCDPQKPRAMPWARSFCPFRACCLYWLLAFRACCLYWLLGLYGELLILASCLQGVLLILASCLQGVLLIWASWPFGCATYMGFKLPNLSSCMVDITQHALQYN